MRLVSINYCLAKIFLPVFTIAVNPTIVVERSLVACGACAVSRECRAVVAQSSVASVRSLISSRLSFYLYYKPNYPSSKSLELYSGTDSQYPGTLKSPIGETIDFWSIIVYNSFIGGLYGQDKNTKE